MDPKPIRGSCGAAEEECVSKLLCWSDSGPCAHRVYPTLAMMDTLFDRHYHRGNKRENERRDLPLSLAPSLSLSLPLSPFSPPLSLYSWFSGVCIINTRLFLFGEEEGDWGRKEGRASPCFIKLEAKLLCGLLIPERPVEDRRDSLFLNISLKQLRSRGQTFSCWHHRRSVKARLACLSLMCCLNQTIKRAWKQLPCLPHCTGPTTPPPPLRASAVRPD